MTDTLPAALDGQQLAVVDVEGNGQAPPEIIEIAVLVVDGGLVRGEDVRSWLVRPVAPISPVVARIHGISNGDVAHSPDWPTIAREVEPLISDCTLVAHNASIEHRVLDEHLPTWQPALVLDTLRLAKQVWPNLPGYSLDNLVRYAGLDTSGIDDQRRHRARYDTWCTWLLLAALVGDGGLTWPAVVQKAALPPFLSKHEPGGGLW